MCIVHGNGFNSHQQPNASNFFKSWAPARHKYCNFLLELGTRDNCCDNLSLSQQLSPVAKNGVHLPKLSCHKSLVVLCLVVACQHYSILYIRVECGHLFWSDRTGQVTNRYHFRSPIPKFLRASRLTHVKVFIFKKFKGAQIFFFFNWHETSF